MFFLRENIECKRRAGERKCPSSCISLSRRNILNLFFPMILFSHVGGIIFFFFPLSPTPECHSKHSGSWLLPSSSLQLFWCIHHSTWSTSFDIFTSFSYLSQRSLISSDQSSDLPHTALLKIFPKDSPFSTCLPDRVGKCKILYTDQSISTNQILPREKRENRDIFGTSNLQNRSYGVSCDA